MILVSKSSQAQELFVKLIHKDPRKLFACSLCDTRIISGLIAGGKRIHVRYVVHMIRSDPRNGIESTSLR